MSNPNMGNDFSLEGYTEEEGVRTPYSFHVTKEGQSFLVGGEKATAITKEQWRDRNFTGCVWFDTNGTPHLRQEEANTYTYVYVQFER